MDLLRSLLTPALPRPPPSPEGPSAATTDAMTAAPTTPLDALTQVIKGPSSTVPGLDGVLTIEEFERFAATNTATSSNRANTSIISTSKTPVSPPEAIPLGRARTTEYVSRFHHLCQTRGLTPTYDFFEPERERFGVRLSVAGKEIEERGPFVNKKIAKEAVAEKGCELLEGGLGAVSAAGQDGKVENWIGILTELGQKTTTPPPVYQEYAVGLAFACETSIHQRPGHIFGGKDKVFPSKKSARQNGAKEAVEWLRQAGYLRNSNSDGTQISNGSTSSSGGDRTVSPAGGNDRQQADGEPPKKESSWAAQVVGQTVPSAICSLLGISPPDYRLFPDQRAPGFHSGAAFFPNDPLIGAGGPVGEVRNVYGKKAAKEECAKGVLQYLGNIVEERKAKAREVIRLSEGIMA